MRHIVRPFVKEFKTRSSKSSTFLPDLADADNETHSKQPFLDLAVQHQETAHDEGYETALKAADELFGKSRSEAIAQVSAPPSKTATGRVLPSLIDQKISLAEARSVETRLVETRLVETEDEKGIAPAIKAARVPSVLRKTSVAVIKEPLETSAAETQNPLASHRERSSIQQRWVQKTALKAGQKWKRRLCEAAR